MNCYQEQSTTGIQWVEETLGDVNETTVKGRKLVVNKKHSVVIRVHQPVSEVDIAVTLNDEPLTAYRGYKSDLRLHPEVQLSNTKMVGLVAVMGTITFHTCDIRKIDADTK